MGSTASKPAARPLARRKVLAWAMYDWANSAYSTLSITLLVAYIQKVVFPPDRYDSLGVVVWAWGISLSMLTAAVLSPIVGAIADAHASKRRWLAGTALAGAGAAMVLGLVPPRYPWLVVALFVITSLLFELSLGFYNGFLPEIAAEESMNRVSAWGYGLGYVGGGLALILAVALMEQGAAFGLPDTATRLRAGLVFMGAWWAVFTLPTLYILRDAAPRPARSVPIRHAVPAALRQVAGTLGNLRAYRMLALFLLAFLFYNDGVQTVISQASTFALAELDFSTSQLIKLILMVQFVALPGALAVGWSADRWGKKPTLMVCLAVWIGLIVAAYFVTTQVQFWILSVVLALVMGGTQSVSRSIMGVMTPRRHAAEFFGFFNLSGKATSFLGTFVFGLTIQVTGSARYAIVSVLVFFVVGTVLMGWVDVARGRAESGGSVA